MIMTLIVTLIIATLLILIFAEGVESAPLARQNQDYAAALEAAQAGVQDYINRLDANTAYYLETSDSSNPAMNGYFANVCPSSSNCSGTSENEYFSYAVNSSNTESTGTVYLTVTGAVSQANCDLSSHTNSCRLSAKRTIKVALSLSSNDSSLYYTKYEIEDPAFVSSFSLGSASNGASTNYQNYCVYDQWSKNTQISTSGSPYYGPDFQNSACTPYLIYFTSADTLNGQIKSDDEFNICGSAKFPSGAQTTYNQATSAAQTGQQFGGAGVYQNGGCSGTPTFCSGNTASYCTGTQPAGSDEDNFPTTNTALEQDLAVAQDGGGCYYQGPIQVTLNPPSGTATTGTMTVKLLTTSTGTSKSLSTLSSGITVESASSCVGTGIAFPNNGLIYDDTGTSGAANVYVSGENAVGPITIGSAANITITNNIEDASTGGTSADIVGLWAQNDILLPDSYSQVSGTSSVVPQRSNLIIDAAMVADSDSIYLPCWTTDNGQTAGSPSGYSTPTSNSVGCPSSSSNPSSYTTTVSGRTTTVRYDFDTQAGSIVGNSSIGDTCNGSAVATPTSTSTSNLGFLTICGSLAQEYRGPVGTENNGDVATGYGKNYNWDQRLQYLQPPYFNAITTPNWTPSYFSECNAVTTPTTTATATGC
jgi:hypothetical protein